MGFDYHISIHLAISPETGLPFTYGSKWEKIPYEPEKHVVPEHLRRYLEGSGRFFHSYMPKDHGVRFIEVVDRWFVVFPSWESICKKHTAAERECHQWTEENHNEFKELIVWLNNNLYATVSWSY
jgi:hypothetical protein